MPTHTKLAVLDAVVTTMIFHGCESWVMSENAASKLDSFQQQSLRHCMAMHPTLGPEGRPRYPAAATVLAAAKRVSLREQVRTRQSAAASKIFSAPRDDMTRNVLNARTMNPRRGGGHKLLANVLLDPTASQLTDTTQQTLLPHPSNGRTIPAEVRSGKAPVTVKGPRRPPTGHEA